MENLSRRSFLQAGAAATGAAVLTGVSPLASATADAVEGACGNEKRCARRMEDGAVLQQLLVRFVALSSKVLFRRWCAGEDSHGRVGR